MKKDIKEIEKLEVKLVKAFDVILVQAPLIYKILKKINIKIEENFPAPAGVRFIKDSNFEMILLKSALINIKHLDLVGLIEHECAHIIYKHLELSRNMNLDPLISNIAQDLVINDTVPHIAERYSEIMNDKKSILNQGIFAPNFKKEYPQYKDVSIKDISSYEIYLFLKKRQAQLKLEDQKASSDSKGDNGKSGDEEKNPNSQKKNEKPQHGNIDNMLRQGNYEGFDSHKIEMVDENGNKVPLDMIARNELESIIKSAINEIKSENERFGSISADFDFIIDSLFKTKTNFKRNLAFFLNSVKNGCKRTWSKLNKRSPYLAKGKLKLKRPKMVLGLDTSGSMMSKEIIEKMKYEIAMYLKECKELWLVGGDTEEKFRINLKINKFDLNKIEFSGGGGTSLQFLWDAASDLKADGIVVHTDGYFDHNVTNHKIKTLVALYGNGPKIEKFKNIKIE